MCLKRIIWLFCTKHPCLRKSNSLFVHNDTIEQPLQRNTMLINTERTYIRQRYTFLLKYLLETFLGLLK